MSFAANAQTPAPAEKTAPERLLPLDAVVNGSKSGTWLFLERAGALYAPREAFEEWRLLLDPDVKSIKFKGQEYWPLASVPGYRSKVNLASQSVELLFAPEAFSKTRLDLKMSASLTVSPAVPSLFLNYDATYQRSKYRTASTLEDLGVIGEVGFSSDVGVLTNSFVGQNLTGNSLGGNRSRFLRLETALTMHQAEKNQTLIVGDTTTRLGLLGSSVYYGGIRFGSNFALTPDFIRHPLPILGGVSAAPSTVNLYINDVLRQTSNIPTGPFAIDNFPALIGSGEARLVVRDLLGRETVITQSFFSSNQLLAAGLDDWSIEAGSVRERLGESSNSYGPTFARGFWRHGYSDTLTLEGIGEVTSKRQKLELGLQSPVAGDWLGSAALAVNRISDLGTVQQWLLGLERQGLRTSAYLQAQGATKNFRIPGQTPGINLNNSRFLGQNPDIIPVKLQLTGNWTYASDSLGSFGLGFVSTTPFGDGRYVQSRLDTMSANYSVRVGEHGLLSLTASRSQGDFNGSSLGLSLMWPLPGNGPVLSASSNRSGNQTNSYLSATQSPTQENNLGWRVLAGQQQNQQHAEGGLIYLGRYGSLTGDVSSSTDQTTLRVNASGGLVLADGHMFATQRANESYALAEVAGYENVGIGLGSNVLSRTDASGIALIPRLSAYQRNSITLAANDLPVSAEIDSIETHVVPAWRSVVKVTFPVRSGRGALLRINLDDGDVAPAGAIVNIEGDKQEFYVARRGEAFVTGLQPNNRVVLKWKERQCSFDVTLPAGTPDDIPRLGPLLCKGITR